MSPKLCRLEPSCLVGALVALTLVLPTWTGLQVLGLHVDFRTWVAAGAMSIYCVHPRGRIWSRINAIDIAVCGLVVTHVMSDWLHGGWSAAVPLLSYGEWALPFAAGRFSMLAHRSIAVLAPWFLVVGSTIAVGAVFESLTEINLWERVFGDVDDLVTRIYGQRYDLLYRAIGPTRQPIFLGIVLMLSAPWAIEWAVRDDRRRWAGRIGIGCIAMGVIATVSRGPLVCLLISFAVIASFYSVWIRWGVVLVTVAVALFAALSWSKVVDVLDRSEALEQRSGIIELGGEFKQYTGTRNRLFVLEIYSPLVLRGGPLGHGTDAVSSFPPNIPGLPSEARARRVLGIVDNSYILIGLRFGWLGLGFLTLLLGSTIYTAFSLARRQSLVSYPHGHAFLVAMGSILIGVCIEILTVFSSYEFFFWILFACGVVSGLAALDARLQRGEVPLC